jgi:hypothetical protein
MPIVPDIRHDSVVLRGVEIDLASDIGHGFIVDCARTLEGTLTEDQVKAKYKLSDADWEGFINNEPLIEKVQRERERRIHNGTATREKAQYLFCDTPDVLDGIIHDGSLSPRHRVDAIRELRAVATGGPENPSAGTSAPFLIRIDLSAAGGEVIELGGQAAGNSSNKAGDDCEPVL